MTTLLFMALVTFAMAVDVHAGSDAIPTYSHGFPYPIDGYTHLAAMIFVGMVASRYAGNWRWLLPAVFVLALAIGLSIGIATRWFDADGVNEVALVSALTCGFLAVTGWRPSPWLLTPLIGFFALFHGYEHGLRLPPDVNAMRHSREIVMATTILLGAGFAIGVGWRLMIQHRPAGSHPSRNNDAPTESPITHVDSETVPVPIMETRSYMALRYRHLRRQASPENVQADVIHGLAG